MGRRPANRSRRTGHNPSPQSLWWDSSLRTQEPRCWNSLMADTPPHTESPITHDTDLIIIGGGPAGCAAARMAASVGMRSVLIEPDTLCRNLYRIPALNNVL